MLTLTSLTWSICKAPTANLWGIKNDRSDIRLPWILRAFSSFGTLVLSTGSLSCIAEPAGRENWSGGSSLRVDVIISVGIGAQACSSQSCGPIGEVCWDRGKTGNSPGKLGLQARGGAVGVAEEEETKRRAGLSRVARDRRCISNVGKEVGCDEYIDGEARQVSAPFSPGLAPYGESIQ
jgi:hypothetical protein